MLIYLRLFKESFVFALTALRNNLLRTVLSLLGVTIGIFAIIAVLAAVDSLERQIQGSLSSLDTSTIFLVKFSFGPTDLKPYQYQDFPNVSYREYQMLQRTMPDIEAASFTQFAPSGSIQGNGETISGANVVPVTSEYYRIERLQLEEGRFFNEVESDAGSPVIVLGHDIAESLYPSSSPVGRKLRLYGRRFTVIGTLEKMGNMGIGQPKDESVYVPVNLTRKIYGDNNRSVTSAIILKPKAGTDYEGFVARLEQKMRTHRGLKPDQINNFFINQLKGFKDFLDEVTGNLTLIGLIISGFSMLVGGFGIANIMFVSVKERTNLIGIQKSLGAKDHFILFQFLFEAIVLAVIGGLLGLLFVYLATFVATSEEFTFVLSLENVVYGIAISASIGLISGILPAISASRLDPVEAIRTGI